jgi:hypothetical protein
MLPFGRAAGASFRGGRSRAGFSSRSAPQWLYPLAPGDRARRSVLSEASTVRRVSWQAFRASAADLLGGNKRLFSEATVPQPARPSVMSQQLKLRTRQASGSVSDICLSSVCIIRMFRPFANAPKWPSSLQKGRIGRLPAREIARGPFATSLVCLGTIAEKEAGFRSLRAGLKKKLSDFSQL